MYLLIRIEGHKLDPQESRLDELLEISAERWRFVTELLDNDSFMLKGLDRADHEGRDVYMIERFRNLTWRERHLLESIPGLTVSVLSKEMADEMRRLLDAPQSHQAHRDDHPDGVGAIWVDNQRPDA